MEQNTDRMGFALIALSIVAVVLIIMNTIFGPTIKGYFQGLQKWSDTIMTQLNPPQQYTHTAYAYSADGKDSFSTTKPNVNVLLGSSQYTKNTPKIFSSSSKDGISYLNDVFVNNLKAGDTYTFTAQTDGNWVNHLSTTDPTKHAVGLWLISPTPGLNVNISLGETVPKIIVIPKTGNYCVRVNTYSNGTDEVTQKFWNFKLESGSMDTAWTSLDSNGVVSDQYIGTYTDTNEQGSQDPSKYTWTKTN